MQIIFAGKAHPADKPGKEVLQSVYQFTRDPCFEGRVAFLEDYDMHLAHLLVQGVDLWLNLPRVPLEACGTSGMKAALNGVPQLSTLDGWWQEGYDGRTAGRSRPAGRHRGRRRRPTPSSSTGCSRSRSCRSTTPATPRRPAGLGGARCGTRSGSPGSRFTARRMVQDYVQEYYVPAMRGRLRPVTIRPRA